MSATSYRSVIWLLVGGLAGCTGPQGNPGDKGDSGAAALVKTSAEAAGANCAGGGVKIEVGTDTDRNGTLDTSEVTSTSFICNGSTGQVGPNGKNTLIATSAEPGGTNCPFGGQKIETGLDANSNGVLDPTEVNAAATRYVCNIAPSGSISPSTGVVVNIKSVSTGAPPIKVQFTLKDDRGFPLDIAGKYSANTAIQPRFALAYFTKDAATGNISPLTVYTKAASATVPAGQPTAYNPATGATYGTLVENGYGAGDYTYTFPTANTANGPFGVAYDATKLNETHVVWMQVTRQIDANFTINANTFFAANPAYYFIPSGTGTPGVREIALTDNCNKCHNGFKLETTTSAGFHGGGRVNAGMCNVCHNPARVSNPQANSASFIHRIHNGAKVATANLFHGIAATYPRDTRDCNACHQGAKQAAQIVTNPSTISCKGCHDYVAFDGTAPITCGILGNLQYGTDGKPLPCNHAAGPKTDAQCAGCHGDANSAAPILASHVPVAAPDPNATWLGGTNNNTHASFVAAGGYVPAGADVITYDLKTVSTWDDNGVKRPQIVFKLKKNGTDVVFQDPGAATEIMPNFQGSPSVIFAYAVPEDGIAQPTDFNVTVTGYLKNIWNGTATTGTGAGTLSAPDATGYYTIKMTGAIVPASATMLTGGVGYAYSLSSAPPLVQTNLADFPIKVVNGKPTGGLSVPAPNAWKVATGFTGRRTIVDNQKCKDCHGTLGVEPSYHAGQRNDGPTCAFCHNPNRTSSAWPANSKYFIHAAHAGRKRAVPYTWHAVSATENYDEIEFPGALNRCSTCHVAGSYNFETLTNLGAVPNFQVATVATGKYNGDPNTNPNWFQISPYVKADNTTDYGTGFSFNAGTGVTVEAAPTTLVISPITDACSACHDTTIAINHMEQNGGMFYKARSQVLSSGGEQCLICHGPGRIAAIGDVHQR